MYQVPKFLFSVFIIAPRNQLFFMIFKKALIGKIGLSETLSRIKMLYVSLGKVVGFSELWCLSVQGRDSNACLAFGD